MALAATACAHCGLPVPGAGEFCCAGCATVHGAIAELGLDRYYSLRDAGDLRETRAPAQTSDASYSELDDAAFARVHVQAGADGLLRTALYLEDLRCTACAWLVEATPRCVPGVDGVRVDLGRSRADVAWDPRAVSLSQIARHLDRLGHPVHPYRGLDRDAQRRREDRALLVKLGVAGAAAGNLMLLAIALYAGATEAALFRWISMLVAVPAIGYAATPILGTALAALRAKQLHLDLPLSIGIVAGLAWGSANVIRGTGEIYFDSISILVFLLLASRWLILRHQRRASSAAEMLLALTPSRARRIDDRGIADVPIDAIAIGDRILVRAGETIAVDGEVASGRSAVDAGLLTGESRPADVAPGDRVHAGTVNLVGPIVVIAAAVGEATRVGALVAAIDALSSRRAQIQRFVDRVAGRFVAVVTGAAALTFAAWAIAASPAIGAERAMALLVVTCPCALALATPLAIAIAIGRAARRGILVKGADALERLATPGTMFVDKTGTLTEGKLAIATWLGDPDARALAGAVEAGSAHPIARAFADAAPAPRPAEAIREVLGSGVTGTVDGRRVAVGAPAWVRGQCRTARDVDGWIAEVATRGETPIAIAVDGAIVAIAGLSDTLRADARAALDELARLGWRIELLSGDDPRAAHAAGRALGLPEERVTGGVAPEAKLAHVEAARRRGPVVMVGDGVNDAAAIAAATCGIAVSGAAEVAVQAADVYLRSPSVSGIAFAVAGARATLATVRRSLRISLVYNVAIGTLAAAGIVTPLVAAVAMPFSSLSVLASAVASRAFRSTAA